MVETPSVSAHNQARPHLLSFWLSDRAAVLALLVMALSGVVLVLVNTSLGPYLSDDSYYYIYPARDFLAGRGFHPSYIFAPMLPLILTGISLPGFDPVAAARWFHALLFGVNIFLVGHVARQAGTPFRFSLLASGLVLLSDVVVEAHGWVMSEALAFTFMLLSLDFILIYLQTQARRYWWLAAATAALTVLTRYAALPLIAAIALTVLLFDPARRAWPKIKSAVAFGIISLLPIAVYWARNQLTSGHPVRYEHFFNEPLTRDQLIWFIYNWFSLFIPGRYLRGHEILAGAAVLIASVLILAAMIWFYRKHWQQFPAQPFTAGVFLFTAVIGMNILMLYLARGLTELDVFNPRYLVPILIVFLILLVTLSSRLWLSAGKWMRSGLVVFFAIFLIYYAYRTFDFSRIMIREGLGYSNIGWHHSETVKYILAHPKETTGMVSTGDMGIYFWTSRMPKGASAFPNPQALKDYLCANNASLFIMNQMPIEIYGLTHDDIAKTLKLAQRFDDSEMYQCPGR